MPTSSRSGRRSGGWDFAINYVLLAGGPQAQKFGMADMEPIEKLIAWAKKTYPINPRRVYMFGKGEGGKISAEFTMTHPNIVTAAITHSWGFWVMPSEMKEAIDFENSAPEIYMNLGLRDLATHLTTVRDTYPRVKAKGYHVIYREFEDMGSRSYYPPSNDDSIAWATRLRNKNIAAFAGGAGAPQGLSQQRGVRDRRWLLPAVGSGRRGAGGRRAAGAVPSKDEKVRAAAAETGSHGLFGEATVAAMAQLAADPRAKVRQAAIRALAMNANWRSQAAQQALIQLATNTSADLDRPHQRHGRARLCRAASGARRSPGPADVPGAGRAAGGQERAVRASANVDPRAGLPARQCDTAVEGARPADGRPGSTRSRPRKPAI